MDSSALRRGALWRLAAQSRSYLGGERAVLRHLQPRFDCRRQDKLHAVLPADDAIDLRRVLPLRPCEAMTWSIVWCKAARGGAVNKRAGHVFSESGCGGPRKHMVSIGG